MLTHQQPLYPTLAGKIAERGVKKSSIASTIGITPRALTNKLVFVN